MIHDSRGILRRGCVTAGAAAAVWSLTVLLTGGLALPLFSSRNPRNPALIAALLLASAFALAEPGRRGTLIAADCRWILSRIRGALARVWTAWARSTEWVEARTPPVVPAALAMAIAAGVIVTSLNYSAFVAAGSDASGYVTQAHMWATGTLRTPEPLISQLSGVMPREALAPLAYRPSPEGSTIVPVTSPGLPMLMAIFERAVGPEAVFAVVPLLAALAIVATWRLGRELSGPWTGVVAAALLATSPAFLFQLTSSPMSDIPAAAFWTLSLAAALRGTTRAAAVSGAAAAVAILIRANLAPVAIVPAAMLWLGRWEHRVGGLLKWTAIRPVVVFAACVLPAALFIAALYTYWYGSPVNSGYGSLGQLYSAANVIPNLARYSQWLLESQTPIILAAAAAPLLVMKRGAALGLMMFTLAVLTCYVAYFPFDVWWYLRFLLPAFPALLTLTAASLVTLAKQLLRPLRAVATIALLLVVADRTIEYAAARTTFDTGGERKYALTGRYVAEHLPGNAVILSEQHSGSIRYYSNRSTIRFGLIPSDHVDGAVAALTRLGYRPYLVVEDWEEEFFRQQFAGRGVLDSLAGPPQFELPLGNVRIYPLAR